MAKRTAPTPLRLDQQLTSGVTTITPAMAEDWLGRNHSNRNIRAARVAQLVRDMETGNFRLTGEAIKFDWDGRLIDGQHRLTAIRDSGITVQALVVHGLDPHVRGVIDTGASRSAADALRMAGVSSASRSMAAAIRLLIGVRRGNVVRAGDSMSPVTHSEVVDFYTAHQEVLDYCLQFAARHYRPMGASPSVLAAAMFLSASNLESFTAFARRVADLLFDGDGDPARVLFRRLQSLRDEPHQRSEELYYILRAFDAHLCGRRLTLLKVANAHGRAKLPTWARPEEAAA